MSENVHTGRVLSTLNQDGTRVAPVRDALDGGSGPAERTLQGA